MLKMEMATAKAPGLYGFAQRLRNLRTQQDTSDLLVQDMFEYCRDIETKLNEQNFKLKENLQNAILDLDDATKSRREFQYRLRASEEEADRLSHENDNLKNRNPYVMLLIDGDGLIFQDHWIQQGLEGGKKAAYALRAAVAAECNSRAGDVEIIAKVVANLGGLSRAMYRCGVADNMNDIKEFWQGFTQAKASFDFIDVGYGKERADSKIKELVKWNLGNHNCKQVLLGIAHDSGYAPFLDEILQDDATRKRVTVLAGSPMAYELRAYDLHVLDFTDDIFRRQKLITDAGPLAPVGPPATQAAIAASPVEKPLTPSPKTAAANLISYAGITKAVTPPPPPPQITLPLASTLAKQTPRPKPEVPAWNPGPRGLDKPIVVSPAVMESMKKKKESERFCNNHFLRGPCNKREVCPFLHNKKPTAEELKGIACLSRNNPCSNMQDCEFDTCIYGHHCPAVKNGECAHPFCKFPEDSHPPGTKFANRNIKQNYY